MVFNGETNNQDLCTLADLKVKTDDTDFPLAEKSMYATMGEKIVATWIFSVYGGWIFDDPANTDFPHATNDLVNGQVDYSTPDLYDLKGVSVKMQGSVSWQKLIPITLEEIQSMGYSESEFMRIAGVPMYYRPISGSVKIYPAANYDQDDSIGLFYTRATAVYTPTSTTKQPAFISLFHEVIGVFMAMTFAEINTLDSAVGLRREFDGNEMVTGIEGGYKKTIKKWYADRYAELKPSAAKPRRNIVNDYV